MDGGGGGGSGGGGGGGGGGSGGGGGGGGGGGVKVRVGKRVGSTSPREGRRVNSLVTGRQASRQAGSDAAHLREPGHLSLPLCIDIVPSLLL